MKASQNYINHIALVLDASTSMTSHAADLVKVADAQIATLAEKSKLEDQETRITVYTFSNPSYHDGLTAKCLVYDKDVLRMPSISGMYSPYGNTALCDAMNTVIDELKVTPTKYGDHSFLLILLTDGEENYSTPDGKKRLPFTLQTLADNWTVAAFVPNAMGRHDMVKLGFPAGNIAIWDASKSGSLIEVGEQIATASASYMAMRSSGQRSTTSLFSMAAPSATTVKKALTPMTEGSYFFLDVTPSDLAQIENGRIDQFVKLKTGKPYVIGRTYYEMIDRVRIQPDKQIAIAVTENSEERVYMGSAARKMLGLPDPSEKKEVRVSPGRWKGYKVYVQSNSMNRKLYAGTRVLVMR